ncbi:class I SAM-dependent methyltransferase [Amycolatopsis cynarae]|uniref:Class I SAM-dependent methyltransferase n=1 Tax=Amycolatopsis cynarae TaxID=2995223 RepID=A0ABY7AXU5_9PSEU|nr:class I SAM-dependent methyltransferase [Amycolatopsis sp. HUAS 11-8]WAL63443.1 class I SAM-dependent methyltransferase [Amycolatopsis sp. HUAS 11-8]
MNGTGGEAPATDIEATRAFFGPRAAGWEDRFPDDVPGYRRAVAELGPPPGGAVADVACGTGRALPELRAAVGEGGTVLGIDLTAEMLAEATRLGRRESAVLVLADAMRLPLATGSLDAVFAAGLLTHLPDPLRGLAELARVARAGARLAVFHPIGRAALAARRGHALRPDDIRAEPHIRSALASTGWRCDSVDDGPDRYLALATRT